MIVGRVIAAPAGVDLTKGGLKRVPRIVVLAIAARPIVAPVNDLASVLPSVARWTVARAIVDPKRVDQGDRDRTPDQANVPRLVARRNHLVPSGVI